MHMQIKIGKYGTRNGGRLHPPTPELRERTQTQERKNAKGLIFAVISTGIVIVDINEVHLDGGHISRSIAREKRVVE